MAAEGRIREKMLKNIKAVIFDLDGTLVDSMWMWHSIDVEFLQTYGHTCPDDLHRMIEGMSFTETAMYFKERFQIQDSIEEIKADWVRMSIDKYRNEVLLKDGAREFLEDAGRRKIAMGIATSNGREMVDAVLDSLGIGGYFSNITTGCDVAMGKPAPDVYLEVAKRLGVRPEDCLVFEDVPAGIMAGKAAGMTVFAVEDVFSREMRREKEALADGMIENYWELLEE